MFCKFLVFVFMKGTHTVFAVLGAVSNGLWGDSFILCRLFMWILVVHSPAEGHLLSYYVSRCCGHADTCLWWTQAHNYIGIVCVGNRVSAYLTLVNAAKEFFFKLNQ